jgi:sporulation protein YlmC with PRC-barrel domain
MHIMMKLSSLFTFSALMLAIPAVALGQAGSTTGQGGMSGSGASNSMGSGSSGTGASSMGAGTSQMGSTAGAGRMTQAQAQELIGADVKNAQNETIGEVEAVQIDQSGMVSNVIVSVGGFLGIGARDVALSWNDLQVAEGGQSVTTTMTKDQLRNMPEYQYSDSSQKGKVFSGNAAGGTTGSTQRQQ